MATVDEVFVEITGSVPASDMHERVDGLKSEYVWDWEDEFDDIHEAYEEQGRGQAEDQALTEAVENCEPAAHLADEDVANLIGRLAAHYELEVD